MKRKNSYKAVEIQKLDVGRVLKALLGAVTVAIDVAKEAIVVGLADASGTTHALVRFSHPKQTVVFFELVERIRELGRDVVIALEPTGTYSAPFVYHLRARGFDVFRVDPKACHDVAAVLDGVSSQHDAKSCTLIAYLHAQGVSKRWREPTSEQRTARALANEHGLWSKPEMRQYGQLEAITASCWPELNAQMEHRSHWYLHLLAAYPGPAAVAAADPAEVRALLRRVTSGLLSPARVEEVLRTAPTTLGVPLEESEQVFLGALARELLRLRGAAAQVEKRMRSFIATGQAESLSRVAAVLGPACAVAMFAEVGDPAAYESAGALLKACGLNLKERSSGRHQGQRRITKRGPPRVRQLLYLTAMRMVLEQAEARAWYERRRAYGAGLKKKVLVAVMRKIVRALVHVARGAPFEPSRLFEPRASRPRGDGPGPLKAKAHHASTSATSPPTPSPGSPTSSVA